MRYEMRVTAYDVMDQIHVAIVLEGSGDWGAEEHTRLVVAADCPGSGEPDPRAWARDALVAAIENL